MSDKHLTLFLTDRGERHQQAALQAAPPKFEVVIRRRPPHAEIVSLLPQVEFLITERSGAVDAEMIKHAGRLRLIQRLGSLVHDIDLRAASEAGIPVCAVPVWGSILVAEHMLMQMLTLAKRLPEASAVAVGEYPGEDRDAWGQSHRTDENTFAYNWSHRRGIESLWGKTAGILGFGEIAVELVRRLRGFGLSRVLYYKRTPLPSQAEVELGVTFAEPTLLVAESDFLCVLLPYSPETDTSIHADVFNQMKPDAFVVGCGSGSVIDEAALADAIRAGRLAGAALDTFEWEPISSDNPLLPLARDPRFNVLLTPHTAAGSGDKTPHQTRATDYDNLLRVLRGQPLLHRVA